jgi:alkylhydroperoxidase family enzyme
MRIKPLTKDQATGNAVKALGAPVGNMNLFRVLAHADSMVLPVMKLGGAILGKPSALDACTREMLVLLALAIEGGSYEWPQHVEIGQAAGISDAQIEAIKNLTVDANVFDQRQQAILAFGQKVVEDVRVAEPIFALAQQYFSEQELVESVVVMGFYMMLARVTEAFEVDIDAAQGNAVIDSLNTK